MLWLLVVQEDFDAILEEIRLFDLQRTAVTETKCPPPSPRFEMLDCYCINCIKNENDIHNYIRAN